MEYNDFVIEMKKKKLKFKDIINKIPNSQGGYYKSKTGLWKAMTKSNNKIENTKKIIFFLKQM